MNKYSNISQCFYEKVYPKCKYCNVKLLAFCGILNDSELKLLGELSNKKMLQKGEQAFIQGDKVNCFYNLRAGSIKIYKISKDGRKQIVGFLFPGDFLGMASGDSYTYTAEALETTTLCSFEKNKIENFFISYPNAEKKILSITNHELSLAQDQIFLLGKYSAKERLLKFFNMLSSQRKKIGWVYNPIKLSMTLSDVSNYLGLTIETVSRNLKALKEDRVISELENKTYFLNKDFFSLN